jgi:asparagine synthase (glutamine-hydrolysing)
MYSLFDDRQKDRLLNPELKPEQSRAVSYLDYWGNGLDGLDTLSRMLYIDTRMWLADDLLNFGDKMSMAASVEARVPILDIDLIGVIESMPANLKLKGWKHGKYIHKKVAKNWLPKETLSRPKKGFPTPVDLWFQKELSGEISEILFSPDSFCSRYFVIDYIRHMIECHVGKKEDFHRQLFALIFFEFWARRFLS